METQVLNIIAKQNINKEIAYLKHVTDYDRYILSEESHLTDKAKKEYLEDLKEVNEALIEMGF